MEEDFGKWLARLATQPLPAGVDAAAVGAAMGAALMAKACRLTLSHQPLTRFERDMVEATLGLVQAQQTELLRLASTDEGAYRAVFHTRGLPAGAPERDQAWQRATTVPIEVAERCRALLDRWSDLSRACWPTVHVDLEIGGWLLEAGVRAGIQAAKSNLKVWGDGPAAQQLQTRIRALQEDQVD
jgi:formiminotetrahydrofolate cyclodeaminase